MSETVLGKQFMEYMEEKRLNRGKSERKNQVCSEVKESQNIMRKVKGAGVMFPSSLPNRIGLGTDSGYDSRETPI